MKGLVDTKKKLRPYVKEQMVQVHEKGRPVIRPLFCDNPKGERRWNISDQYMFGTDSGSPQAFL